MVELQRLTGMRPGEVCGLTLAEVDAPGRCGYTGRRHHKTAHHGKPRVIPIGPRALALLVAFLRRDGTPPDGFAHVEPNNPDHRDARLVMADAYEEAGRSRDAAYSVIVAGRSCSRVRGRSARATVQPEPKSREEGSRRHERSGRARFRRRREAAEGEAEAATRP